MPRSAQSAPSSSPKKPKSAKKTSSEAKKVKASIKEGIDSDLLSTNLTKMVLRSSSPLLKPEEAAPAKKEDGQKESSELVFGPVPPPKKGAKKGAIKFNKKGEKLIKTCCFGWLTEVQKAKYDVFDNFPMLVPDEDSYNQFGCLVYHRTENFDIGLGEEIDFAKSSKICIQCLYKDFFSHVDIHYQAMSMVPAIKNEIVKMCFFEAYFRGYYITQRMSLAPVLDCSFKGNKTKPACCSNKII